MSGSRLIFFTAIGSLLFTGCTLSPFYHRPDLPVENRWPGAEETKAAPAAVADLGWREFFLDPQLQKMIETALANNRDLRMAILNVEAARAQYRLQRSDLFPAVNAVGSELAERLPVELSIPGAPSTTREYEAGVGFTSYEIDFFGRIRSLNKRAFENYLSVAEARRSAQIALVSEVAVQYLTWLANRDLLQLTKDTLASQQASYDLTKRRFDAGVSTELDVSQALSAVDVARANLALYSRQLMQSANALQLLLGAPLPSDLPPGLHFEDETVLSNLREGLPSDLLLRRPDIRAAEHQLIAANANIGAARAAFFPSISLTGNFGSASTHLSGLFQSASQIWVFNPQISLPIFAGGANFANLNLANVEKKIEIAQYEKSIQVAFREVSDALAGRQTLDSQVVAQEDLVLASSESYKLSDMRFRAGVDNYLTVIVSQRTLYAAQQDLISVKLLRLENLVTLYKVLGGGWNEHSKVPVPATRTSAEPSLPLPTGSSAP